MLLCFHIFDCCLARFEHTDCVIGTARNNVFRIRPVNVKNLLAMS